MSIKNWTLVSLIVQVVIVIWLIGVVFFTKVDFYYYCYFVKPAKFVVSRMIFSIAGVMNRWNIEMMSSTWETTNLVGPWVIFMKFCAAMVMRTMLSCHFLEKKFSFSFFIWRWCIMLWVVFFPIPYVIFFIFIFQIECALLEIWKNLLYGLLGDETYTHGFSIERTQGHLKYI